LLLITNKLPVVIGAESVSRCHRPIRKLPAFAGWLERHPATHFPAPVQVTIGHTNEVVHSDAVVPEVSRGHTRGAVAAI
jgi:hypothetical protein